MVGSNAFTAYPVGNSTQVALNYHLDPDNAQLVYNQIGLDYANRIIIPAIQESVKQVTARFNVEELITKRESSTDRS